MDINNSQNSYRYLITDEQRAKELISGSYLSSDHPVEAWERGRCFIASTINHDGTILDIGCANGFLLKSLQAWCSYTLDPYGIDANDDDISKAKELFPDLTDHFITAQLHIFLKNYPSHFPQKFDFIYWAVWTNYDLTKEEIHEVLTHINENGRLILGFYPDDSHEPSDIRNNSDKVREFGFDMIIVENPTPQRSEKLVIIEK